jgi:hypothetical protein
MCSAAPVDDRLVAKILRGIRVEDLPVENVDKIDLVINLKTAKALGIQVPAALLAQADRRQASPLFGFDSHQKLRWRPMMDGQSCVSTKFPTQPHPIARWARRRSRHVYRLG